MTKILIVDDSKFACNKFKEMISQVSSKMSSKIVGDFDIQTVNSSREAEKWICSDSKSFDIIFLDYNMPELNGLELASVISKKSPTTKIVMLTATSAFATGSQKVPEYILLMQKPPTSMMFEELFVKLGVPAGKPQDSSMAEGKKNLLEAAFAEGVASAADALKNMMDVQLQWERRNLSVTVKKLSEVSSLPSGDHHDYVVMEIERQVFGEIVVILKSPGADELVSVFLGTNDKARIVQERADVLCEVLNVTMNACLLSISKSLAIPFEAGVPRLLSGDGLDVGKLLKKGGGNPDVVVFRAEFIVPQRNFSWDISIMFAKDIIK